MASAGTPVISPTISFSILAAGAVHTIERVSPALLLLFSYMSGYEPGDRPTILSSQFRVTLGVGMVVVLIAVGIVLFLQRGAHIELKGAILKVRTLAMSEHSSIAAVDFRFANPSSYPFVVRTVDVSETGSAGDDHPGSPVSEVDAKRLFQFYPVLGQKFNDSLLMGDKIAGRTTQDRMIVARFEIPVAQLDARKSLTIRIEDVDGPVSELVEK